MTDAKKTTNKVQTTVKDKAQLDYNLVDVSCACGAKYKIGTTAPGPIRVAICSNCHPFYTGEQKIVDTENLVAKFEKKAEKASTDTKSRADRRLEKRAARAKVSVSPTAPTKELTLKDIMQALQKGN